MKPKTLILPVVTGLAAIIWLISQRYSIATLEKENAELKKRIASNSLPVSTTSRNHIPKQIGGQNNKVNWSGIGAFYAEISSNGGTSESREMMDFRRLLSGMTAGEIASGVDEIALLGLDKDVRSHLERLLFEALVQKDSQLALDRFISSIHQNANWIEWPISEAFRKLAEQDPVKMTRWFDAAIAAGKFDSKALDRRGDIRFRFEGALIRVLLKSDQPGAFKRLEDVPPDLRGDPLTYIHFTSDAPVAELVAFGRMARKYLKGDERLEAISRPLYSFKSDEAYVKATDYLEQVQATPEERAEAVKSFANSQISGFAQGGGLTITEIDRLREWVGKNSSESVDKLTAQALARAMLGDKTPFERVAKLALHYHQTTGNDVFLSAFLDPAYVRSHKQESRILAEEITNPKLRQEVLDRLK